MKEDRQLEFKSDISNTFLKTVSAFANYDGGQILFGVGDTGEIIGLKDPVKNCIEIENQMNAETRKKNKYAL